MDKTYLGKVTGIPFFHSSDIATELPLNKRTTTKGYRVCPNCGTQYSRYNGFMVPPTLHMRVLRRDRYKSDSESQIVAFNFPMIIQWMDHGCVYHGLVSLSEHDANPSLFETNDRYLYQITEFGYREVFRCDQCGSFIISDPIHLGMGAGILQSEMIPVIDSINFVTNQVTGYFISNKSILQENPSITNLEIVKKYRNASLIAIFHQDDRPGIQEIDGILPVIDVNCTDSRNIKGDSRVIYHNDIFQIKNSEERVDMRDLSKLYRTHCAYPMTLIHRGTLSANEMDPLLEIIRTYGVDRIRILSSNDHWR